VKIVVLDGYTTNPGDLSWDPLIELGDLTVFDRTGRDEMGEHAADADAVLTNKTVLNREALRKIPNLRYIGVLATGTNVVNLQAAAKRNLVVTNVPAYSTPSVAEHVFALILEMARNVEWHAHSVRKGRWSRSLDFCYWNAPLIELAGKTLGIVGFGRTGQAVARRALAFEMRVLVHTRTPPSIRPPGIEFAELERVFRESDIVSLHVPLAPDTENLVNSTRLALMKPAAWLVNTSRGGVVEETALADALTRKAIAGAALDVLSEEPPPPENPLLRAPNCLITPHHAWASRAARERLIRAAADNLAAFLAGKPQNAVPLPAAEAGHG
jgi:glycerate dehydrogenase